MTTLLDEFVGKLGWQVDESGPKKFAAQRSSITSGLAKIGAAYAAVSGLVTGFVAHTNAATAATYRTARGLGVSYEWFDRWGDALGKMMGGSDGMSRSLLLMQRNIGNAARGGTEQAAAIREIGLETKALQALDPGAQYEKVLTAVTAIEDPTRRAALSQKVFGREGARSVTLLGGYLQQTGQTLGQYVGRFDALSFETERSAAGAFRFSEGLGALRYAADEAKSAFSGMLGEALSPMIEDMIAWVKVNRDLIRTKLEQWAQSAARWLAAFWRQVKAVGEAVGGLVDLVGGLGNALKIIGALFVANKVRVMTRGVTELSLSLKGATANANLLTGALGAVAAVSFADLAQSLNDVSNPSWGNRIARNMLAWVDNFSLGSAKARGVVIDDANSMQEGLRAIWASQDSLTARQWAMHAKAWEGAEEKLRSFGRFFVKVWDDARLNAGLVLTYIENKLRDLSASPFFKWIRSVWGVGIDVKGASGYAAGVVTGDRGGMAPTAPAYIAQGPVWTPQQSVSTGNNYAPTMTVNAPVTVNAAPGMSESAVASAVVAEVERMANRAQRSLSK